MLRCSGSRSRVGIEENHVYEYEDGIAMAFEQVSLIEFPLLKSCS